MAKEIPRLRRYALGLMNDPAEADDLVQDCLERAIRKRHLRMRRGSIRTWLYKILYNVFINQSARRNRIRQRTTFEEAGFAPSEPAHRERQIVYREIAAAAILTAVGLVGWFAGQYGQSDSWSADDFLRHSFDSYRRPLANTNTATTATQGGTINAMQWLSQRISSSLKVPDPGEVGYVVADRRTYTSKDGRSFGLFLQPRWDDSEPGVRVTREKNMLLAYRFDGPLAHAVVSRLPPAETRELALAVRRVMHDPEASPPAVKLTPPLRPGLGVANGGHANQDSTRVDDLATKPLAPDPGRERISTN